MSQSILLLGISLADDGNLPYFEVSMFKRYSLLALIVVVGLGSFTLLSVLGSSVRPRPQMPSKKAQSPRPPSSKRVEQEKTSQDQSDIFSGTAAPLSSPALENQADQGKMPGFDFARDPLNAKRPMQPAEEIMKNDIAEKPKITDAQRRLLEQHYDLKPRLDPAVKMSRGKPLAVGPTARLSEGATWQSLTQMSPDEIRKRGLFPYPALPYPKHVAGGMVFPQAQIEMFPRLERFDVEFDIPEAFVPEFPPAMFLQNRPELGDVSRGEVVSVNKFFRLFKDLLTPVQLDGLRWLVFPFPQEEFNATDDRKTVNPSLGVSCFDCHLNGHTTARFHLNPDDRPQHRRFRLNTTSLRGIFNQQIHGSKRSLRSVEDFTLKLNVFGRLDPAKANQSELRGEAVFFGKGQCAACHVPPFYLDDKMHDLRVERFLNEPPRGPIKTFTLRGIKDSPPYLHDGRLLTLEDTAAFFNLVLGTKMNEQEKRDLVAFMRQL
jgi:cytochrome c peroxidase